MQNINVGPYLKIHIILFISKDFGPILILWLFINIYFIFGNSIAILLFKTPIHMHFLHKRPKLRLKGTKSSTWGEGWWQTKMSKFVFLLYHCAKLFDCLSDCWPSAGNCWMLGVKYVLLSCPIHRHVLVAVVVIIIAGSVVCLVVVFCLVMVN